MSKISLAPDASGTGIFTIASPNSDTNRTLTLPDDTGTIVTNSGNQAGSFTTLNTSGAVVFNDAGADVDFRVEGDTDANLLFVDASTDRVGIGTSSPAVSGLEISRATGTATPTPVELRLSTTNTASDWSTTDPWGRISFYSADTSAGGSKIVTSIDCIANATSGGNGNLVFNYTPTGTATLTEAMRIDASGNVGIGASAPAARLEISGGNAGVTNPLLSPNRLRFTDSDTTKANNQVTGGVEWYTADTDAAGVYAYISSATNSAGAGYVTFATGSSSTIAERMRIDSSGNFMVGKTSNSATVAGLTVEPNGRINPTVDGSYNMYVNRLSSDGTLVYFAQANTVEGEISVSGTTVTYGGGHLARWGQLLDGSKDESILKGTVLSNLDEMCVWSAPTTYWTEEDELPVDEEGNPTVAVGDVKKEAFVADNEQCNKIKVSDVEGDANVAGVFVSWTYDEQFNSNDLFVAMTGDMIIRIGEGVTVARGDLLMSAGDGTAKPQGDDIVRSKTVAKVTSTHVTCTYEDGSYCVPCVLMAC